MFWKHGSHMKSPLLTRYEVARVVGLRALQLGDGASPMVHIEDETLRTDSVYVAARELEARLLKARVKRDHTTVDVHDARLPLSLYILLDTRDGGDRTSGILNYSSSVK